MLLLFGSHPTSLKGLPLKDSKILESDPKAKIWVTNFLHLDYLELKWAILENYSHGFRSMISSVADYFQNVTGQDLNYDCLEATRDYYYFQNSATYCYHQSIFASKVGQPKRQHSRLVNFRQHFKAGQEVCKMIRWAALRVFTFPKCPMSAEACWVVQHSSDFHNFRLRQEDFQLLNHFHCLLYWRLFKL